VIRLIECCTGQVSGAYLAAAAALGVLQRGRSLCDGDADQRRRRSRGQRLHQRLVHGLGGVARTAEAFAWFREQAVKAGLPGLHLQLTSWGANNLNLSGVDAGACATPSENVKIMGFDSQTHYQMVHFTHIDRDYAAIIPDMVKEW